VEALVIAPAAEAPTIRLNEAVAVAGRGLQGDRYFAGTARSSPAVRAAH
jgi:hypothetical protein